MVERCSQDWEAASVIGEGAEGCLTTEGTETTEAVGQKGFPSAGHRERGSVNRPGLPVCLTLTGKRPCRKLPAKVPIRT